MDAAFVCLPRVRKLFLAALATMPTLSSIAFGDDCESAPVQAAESVAARGRELFTRVWEPKIPSATQGDGLGPYFNERSCAGCHKQAGVGGGGPADNNVQLLALVERRYHPGGAVRNTLSEAVAKPMVIVLHRRATIAGYDTLRALRLSVAAPRKLGERLSPELEQAIPDLFRFHGKQYEPAPFGAIEERNTPALFGAGLIDLVEPETLEELATRQPDAIRGRPAWLADGDVGRFGWKGQNATLFDFCENACAVELGLGTPSRPQPPAPFERREPGTRSDRYHGPILPDMTTAEVAELTAFVASLPPPRRELPDERDERQLARGEYLFQAIGCANCHTPDVGDVKGIYSDLLLHRVGTTGLAYYETITPPPGDIVSGRRFVPAAPDEFRTPPLWGVAESAPYMHDGGCNTLDGAIREHGGQAALASRQYRSLNPLERDAVIAFLNTLRAPELTP